jgi:hypothetical protein
MRKPQWDSKIIMMKGESKRQPATEAPPIFHASSFSRERGKTHRITAIV